MKFSENWLREWVSFKLDTNQLAEQLTMSGLEVESIELHSENRDVLIELNLTPNRGDCLSLMGIARELGTLNKTSINVPKILPIAPQNNKKFEVRIDLPLYCPRYVGRMITGIHLGVTPLWIQERLEQSDIRCIHPIVDILNYVMLELGQPMHAFDADKLSEAIIVRKAEEGEKLILLDGQEITLKETLVIADSQKPLALAGIMGGLESSVQNETCNIFLESAFFTPHLMAGIARQYGLNTDSSFRFERGVDFNLQTTAIERATVLIHQICGGEVGPLIEVVDSEYLPKQPSITLRYERIAKVVGYKIASENIVDILTRLGCEIEQNNHAPSQEWKIIPPSYRYDLHLEIDLIEEIVRVFGYNNVPNTLPVAHLQFVPQSQTHVCEERIKRAFVDFGYQEVITYSFVDEFLQKTLFPDVHALSLLNPISSEMNVMRMSLWPGLLNTLKYNQNRQQNRLKIFEIGMCFFKTEQQFSQENLVGGLICGNDFNEHWDLKPKQIDFFDLKQSLESLWLLLGQKESLAFNAITHTACHPSQCAQIIWQGKNIGTLGRLHPHIEKELAMDGPVYLFEFQLTPFLNIPLPTFMRPSRFPEIRRDIAVLVDIGLASNKLVDCIKKTANYLLQEVILFDVYRGKGVDSGRKSVALGLILQHPSRTLVDAEVDDVVRSVVKELQREFDAKLRD